jgi:hypothetical protein|tara:strand:- start:527 stop:799 length:273 start_codon:yes stop_codon:yes gene_type:complete
MRKARVAGIVGLGLLALAPMLANAAPYKKQGVDTYKIFQKGKEFARWSVDRLQFVSYWWEEDLWTCQISITSLECWLGDYWTDKDYKRDK